MALLVLAIGAGSLFFSHVNDAGFWLVKEYFGMTVGQTIKTWSVMETIISVVGLITVLLVEPGLMSPAQVVLGVDIGTTSTKVVAYDTAGQARHSHSAGYPLEEPHPGHAEQDPALILDAVLESVREVVAALDGPVAGLSFSSAMHTLIGARPRLAPADPVAELGRLPVRRAGRAAAGGRRRARPAPADRHPGAPDGAAAEAGLVPRAAAGRVRQDGAPGWASRTTSCSGCATRWSPTTRSPPAAG